MACLGTQSFITNYWNLWSTISGLISHKGPSVSGTLTFNQLSQRFHHNLIDIEINGMKLYLADNLKHCIVTYNL